MNREQIRNKARKGIGETTAAFWSDAELNTWIDDTCDDLAFQTKCLKTNGLASLTVDVGEYVMSTTFTGVIVMLDVYHYRNGDTWEKLLPISIPELNRDYPGWKSADSGVPTHYYWDKEDDIFGIYLAPDSSNDGTNYIKAYYATGHTDISTDAVAIDIPLTLHEAIVDGLIAYCLEQRGSRDSAMYHWKKYGARVNAYLTTKENERTDDDIIMVPRY
jgi:hypothetical protein